jgi:hypothetical protein
MGYTQRLTWETLRTLDTASSPFSTGVYTAVGTELLHPSYILKMVNNSNVLVTVSIDGTTDIDVAPANSFWLYDESKVGASGAFPAMPQGTQIYVKSGTGAAGVGLVYVVSQYIIVN